MLPAFLVYFILCKVISLFKLKQLLPLRKKLVLYLYLHYFYTYIYSGPTIVLEIYFHRLLIFPLSTIYVKRYTFCTYIFTVFITIILLIVLQKKKCLTDLLPRLLHVISNGDYGGITQ